MKVSESLKEQALNILISIKGKNFRYLIADDSFSSNMVPLNDHNKQLQLLGASQIYLFMVNYKSLFKVKHS